MNKLIKALKNPRLAIKVLKIKRLESKAGQKLDDTTYLKKKFKIIMGYPLNLDNPQTFNEKLQWLKLYDRKPIYTTLVDKYAVKRYVSDLIGEEYIIPTIGVWDNFDQIDFDSLPNQFVLKCTHDSGGLVICKDKSILDKNKAKVKIEKSLKNDYYLQHREWPYKDVPRKIIAEKYMTDESGVELKDYKFFCFGGKVKVLFIATDRQTDTKFDFYDEKFNHLPFTNGHPNTNKEIKKPQNFDEMICLAERLSSNIPHVRVDLYNISGKIYFGEMTFYHWSGFVPFVPVLWDKTFGDWIRLPIDDKN